MPLEKYFVNLVLIMPCNVYLMQVRQHQNAVLREVGRVAASLPVPLARQRRPTKKLALPPRRNTETIYFNKAK
jgi:hypothetical protein